MIRLKDNEKREYSMKERLDVARGVMSIVAQYYGMNVEEMVSKRRDKKYANPRYVSMFLAQMYLPHIPIKKDELGKLHGLGHSCAIRSVHEIVERRKYDASLRHDIRDLEKLIDKYIKNPDQ